MAKNPARPLEYLDFIVAYWKQHKCSPNMREIADHFHTSTSVVNYYLERLERDGKIVPREYGQARAIIPTEIADLIDAHFRD